MNRMWKAGIALVALGVLAVTAVGFVAAQSDERVPLGDRVNDFLGRLAGNLGITQEELESAIDETQLEIVDEKLAEGIIDEEQAQRLREAIESGEHPFFFLFGKHRGHHGAGYHVVAQVAELTGLEPQEVVEAWTGGQTLVEIAGENGVSEQELHDALMEKIEERVAQALEAEKIDQERADEILANADGKITEVINSEGPPQGPSKFRGRFGPNGDGPKDTPTTRASGLLF